MNEMKRSERYYYVLKFFFIFCPFPFYLFPTYTSHMHNSLPSIYMHVYTILFYVYIHAYTIIPYVCSFVHIY